ncbi:MAG: hypothetical protein ACSHWY_01480 [Octadecabacter sp.]
MARFLDRGLNKLLTYRGGCASILLEGLGVPNNVQSSGIGNRA